MKVMLVNPRLKTWSPNVYLPLGLAYIAAVLEKAGHYVRIIDMNSNKISDSYLGNALRTTEIVGITGMLTEYKEILRLCDIAKEINEETKVVLGGALATTQANRILNSTKADIVVLGEGEETTVELVKAVEEKRELKDISGIAYKNNGTIITNVIRQPIKNLDTVPYPARHLLDISRYTTHHFRDFGIKIDKGVKSTTMITSRGCPYNCTFCFKDVWGHKWRGRSPENIIGEMRQLKEKYGFNSFVFNDDTFVLDNERVEKLCRQLIDSKMNIKFYCNGRVNLMTKEMLEIMHEAGCVGIGYGLESGNQQILDAIKKSITLEQVRQVVKWTKEVGICTTGYFVIGLPGETKATMEKTRNFAREIDLNFYAFAILAPFIGTPLYESAKEKGLISSKHELEDWSVHATANLTKDCTTKEIEQFNREMFREFTIQKRYGKHYLLNPKLWRDGIRSLLFVIGKRSYKNLLRKAWEIITGE